MIPHLGPGLGSQVGGGAHLQIQKEGLGTPKGVGRDAHVPQPPALTLTEPCIW